MLKDLVHYGLLLLSNFDGNPLRDDDGDTTADDVETRFPLARFSNESVRKERIEVKLVVQNVGSKTNCCVDGVFEKDILVVRSYNHQRECKSRWQ